MLGKDRDLMLDMKPGGILVGWAPCLITLAEENLSIRQNYRTCSVSKVKKLLGNFEYTPFVLIHELNIK